MTIEEETTKLNAAPESGAVLALPKREPESNSGAREAILIDETMWSTVHTLHSQGQSKKAIARSLGLDIKTVRKWLRQPWTPQKRRGRPGKLAQYHPLVCRRAPEVDYNAVVLLRELREVGYVGSYATLTRFLGSLRPPGSHEVATVRFETGPGEQAQVDWGQMTLEVGGRKIRVHLFTMVLGFCRRIYARAYNNERLESLLDGHELAFAHFGGRTRTILYDNPRTVVTSKNQSTGEITWNHAFKDRMDFYGVTVRLCRYYRAQTKGKVESGVKYVKRNALAGQSFASMEELNAYLEKWCLEVADQRVHGTTHEVPAVRFEREASHLIGVTLRPVAPFERSESRRVARDAYLEVHTNRYPVPWSWVGHDVQIKVRSTEIVVLAPQALSPTKHQVKKHQVKEAEWEKAVCEIRFELLRGRHQLAHWPRELPPRGPIPRPSPVMGVNSSRDQEERDHLKTSFLEQTGHVEPRSLELYEEVAA